MRCYTVVEVTSSLYYFVIILVFMFVVVERRSWWTNWREPASAPLMLSTAHNINAG